MGDNDKDYDPRRQGERRQEFTFMLVNKNFVRLSIDWIQQCIRQKRNRRIASIIPNSGGYTQCHYTVVSGNFAEPINDREIAVSLKKQ